MNPFPSNYCKHFLKVYFFKTFSGIFLVKPRILQSLKNHDLRNRSSFQLNCSGFGDPALTYSWTMNGSETIPNAELINKNKTLHIYPVNIKNEGTYTCLIKNVEGNASTTSNITVFGEFYYHL